jgi:hypothetical protein
MVAHEASIPQAAAASKALPMRRLAVTTLVVSMIALFRSSLMRKD